jgi:hypothetical protein
MWPSADASSLPEAQRASSQASARLDSSSAMPNRQTAATTLAVVTVADCSAAVKMSARELASIISNSSWSSGGGTLPPPRRRAVQSQRWSASAVAPLASGAASVGMMRHSTAVQPRLTTAGSSMRTAFMPATAERASRHWQAVNERPKM